MIYLDRLLVLLKEAGIFIASALGAILLFALCMVGTTLYLILFPIVLAATILEYILVPVPYFIITGDRFFDKYSSLIGMYIDLLDDIEEEIFF